MVQRLLLQPRHTDFYCSVFWTEENISRRYLFSLLLRLYASKHLLILCTRDASSHKRLWKITVIKIHKVKFHAVPLYDNRRGKTPRTCGTDSLNNIGTLCTYRNISWALICPSLNVYRRNVMWKYFSHCFPVSERVFVLRFSGFARFCYCWEKC